MSEHADLPRAQHEASDVGPRFFLIGVAVMTATLVLLALLGLLLYPGSTRDRSIALPLPAAPSPALQTSPRADMQDFLHRELQTLNSVGWIDRARGIVHIPIEDAMRKVAQEGIPGWPGPGTPSPVDPNAAGQRQEGAARP